MKPRLEVAPLTVEDKTIWNRLADRNPSGTEWYNSTSQDRRDADLMLSLSLREESRRQYLNLRRYALSIGGTTTDWPDWRRREMP